MRGYFQVRRIAQVIGQGRISQFIEALIRSYVRGKDMEAAYRAMSQDEEREAEALEWAEATLATHQS